MENSEMSLFKNAIQVVANDYIAVKPCCELFELDYKYQVERIRTDFLMGQLVGKNPLTGADGKQYQMLSLPKSGFLRWVYTLNPNNVAANHRQKFIQFVTYIHEYLFGDTNPAKLAQEKQRHLSDLREKMGNVDIDLHLKKQELADLKVKKKKLDVEFWDVFNTDPSQLKLNMS